MKLMSQTLRFLAVISLFLGVAHARSTTIADSFRVTGMRSFYGKKLSVYYVSARPATLGTPGQIARVHKVMKGPVTFNIGPGGEVLVPEAYVPRDGWTNFNHIVLVIHSQTRHALQNADGSIPDSLEGESQYPYNAENAQFLYRKSVDYNRVYGEIPIF